MMSYLRPLHFQPQTLEILCQDSWLSVAIALVKRNTIPESEDWIEPHKHDLRSLRTQILAEYLDVHLPVRIQERTFLRGIQALRNELSCNEDIFPNLFRLFWRRGFVHLHLPHSPHGKDRIKVLEFLDSYSSFSNDGNEEFLMVENAKFRLFDRSWLNIQESYLMKRVLRMLPFLRHCILWKSCDDIMLQIIGESCPNLETLDLWRSLNVSDLGIKGLLCSEGKISSTLRKIVLKDTSVSVIGAMEVVLSCPRLESIDLNNGDVIQEFFQRIRKVDPLRTFPLKSLFLPIVQGKENIKDILKLFSKLEDLTIWTTCPYLKSFQQIVLPDLRTLKLGGLHSSLILTEFLESVGQQLTTLKIEAMHAQVPLNSIGENCPNLQEFHVINARIYSSSHHKCADSNIFLKLKFVYFFLVQYSSSENDQEDEHMNLSRDKSALHCLLTHAQNLEGIQATGSQDLSDNCLRSILLQCNPFRSLKRFMLTSPFTFSSDPPQVPLVLTSSSVILLAENCPNIVCIGDLRHWNIYPSERRILIKKAQKWACLSETTMSTTPTAPE